MQEDKGCRGDGGGSELTVAVRDIVWAIRPGSSGRGMAVGKAGWPDGRDAAVMEIRRSMSGGQVKPASGSLGRPAGVGIWLAGCSAWLFQSWEDGEDTAMAVHRC